MELKNKFQVFVFIFILFTNVDQGSTFVVYPSGCTYSSIQSAINGANSGEVPVNKESGGGDIG
ncbi:MAG: hypothetical protein ACE5J9_01545 [Methanosarcinales archaeon]